MPFFTGNVSLLISPPLGLCETAFGALNTNLTHNTKRFLIIHTKLTSTSLLPSPSSPSTTCRAPFPPHHLLLKIRLGPHHRPHHHQSPLRPQRHAPRGSPLPLNLRLDHLPPPQNPKA